jgi:site-specific recombinase XerD
MVTITLSIKLQAAEERIFIAFPYNKTINDFVRQVPGVKWSAAAKQWHLPVDKSAVQALEKNIQSFAQLDTRVLKNQLLERKQNTTAAPSLPLTKYSTSYPMKRAINMRKIRPVNAHILPLMKQQLKLKAYSLSTISTYLNEMSQLLQALRDIPADDLQPVHLKRYLVYCLDKLGLKENTLHSRINAMKFYYEQILGKDRFFWQIPRPKKPLLLPKLLNETELRKLFNALTNKKHKAMLFTAYSAGLRVSEIVNLKIADIDSKRMQIFIGRAKGKKDRYVNLSPLLLDILRKYVKEYSPRPREYLFESEQTREPYPIRTVQQIFSNAKRAAGITKSVGIHSLRHSFATHLLDKGTDIKYIKDLLGHFNIKTTERYLHVSKKQLVNIVSPFDDLWKNERIEW